MITLYFFISLPAMEKKWTSYFIKNDEEFRLG